jgi:predicted DNA-binding protein (UPF0251 family)
MIIMSPRPTRLRRVSNPPVISGFKPYGGVLLEGQPGTVFLHLEEYEVIRLCDYENLSHHEAARVMDVSRPTLTRIYARARAKIADALVTGKQVIIEGGKVYFDSEWYKCNGCSCMFNQPEKTSVPRRCPLCGSRSITGYVPVEEPAVSAALTHPALCVCPVCGFEKEHKPGFRCMDELCPVCNSGLIRKDNLTAK